MNNKKSLIYSIIALLLIAAIVAGSTYAYFQWTSGEDDRTGVNVTIEAEQVTMHIEPETTVYTNLRPTNNCNNSYAYGDALVTIENHTGAMAIPSFKLNVKVTKNGTGNLTSDDLKHIHYSVVLLETNSSNGSKGAGVLNEGSCANPANFNLENSNLYFTGITEGSVTGTFQTVSTNGEWSDLPSAENTYLPRQFNTVNVTSHGATYLGMPHSTSYQWFRVYVWMDHEYVYTNTGSEVSDPLQNAKIEVTWSENSMIEQVSSIISGGDVEEVVKAAGSYDSEGNLTTWDTLVTNGDITVENGVITNSNKSLTGELVISNLVTEIGVAAFESSSLSKIIIPNTVTKISDGAFVNSSLESVVIGNSVTTIGVSAFSSTKLTNVVIPDSVTTIGNYAFDTTLLESVVIGDYVETIGDGAFSVTNLTSVIIPDSVTEIGDAAFASTKLTNVVIPDSVISLGTAAFASCSDLISVVIGNSVASINMSIFYDDFLLESVIIPKSVTTIEKFAFANTLLTNVYYEGTEEEWNNISIDNTDNLNNSLINATKHYNYTR